LRIDYPKQTIRNAVVFASAVQEFARLAHLIQLHFAFD